MITPRTTRLLRAPDLRAYRDALVALACDGSPFDIRDRVLVVPTRAAASHVVRSIERRVPAVAVTLPDLITPGELTAHFGDRLPAVTVRFTDAEREALLGVACRDAAAAGAEPPFRLRPGLIAEVLRFYDALRRNQKDVATFERLALGALEPGAGIDRGAERLVRQTRFLAAAFRRFEALCDAARRVDEHRLRDAVLATPAPRPIRHVVLAVTDRASDPLGLTPADWDLLTRVSGLERLDVLVTDVTLAGALHERLHQVLPGVREERVGGAGSGAGPTLLLPPGGGVAYTARDREDEVAAFARWVKQAARAGEVADLDRVALVVRQPLPYVYLARDVLRSAGIPAQMFDALPLAAEPYAAALDLVFSCVSANFARIPAIALLRSPHFRFDGVHDARDVAALDRALSEAGYLGEHDALTRTLAGWREGQPQRGLLPGALRAGQALDAVVRELLPLREPAPAADHLDRLLAFVRGHEHLPGPDDPLRARQLRARAAIVGILAMLRDAYRRFDPAPVEFDDVAAMVRRRIEEQTFAPRTGDAGVHVVDAEAARFGDFDHVQLAGLVDGEWPERPRRSIFYSSSILRDLGWTGETERLNAARAAFADLLRLASARVRISSFSLEEDAIVSPSTLLDEVGGASLDAVEAAEDLTAIFEYEALAAGAPRAADDRFRGQTHAHVAGALSLSALERYQDCPFKFFAADVLRLEEVPEDEPSLSPRARGRFIHEVFQRCFEAWDATGAGTMTSDRFNEARALFAAVAEPLLQRLPDAEAALERARLFGSAIAVGLVDVVLGLEAARPVAVIERWLEHRFEGDFALGAATPDARRVALKGVVDRVDLLAGRRLRVIDYKSGSAPNPRRALQVAIYALCAQEMLAARDGAAWQVDEAAYVALSGKRPVAAVVKSGAADGAAALAAARDRLLAILDGVGAGEFPPRPHDPQICSWCAYAAVCRKDYVGDE